ncbi:hypothetical protein [Sinomonas halotolerans]|uniref:Uncharacterized protein n=1 Tax=Sinomonas halotolerans TaxID=1644133 RepID=A0ABU9X2T1_9MICC
MSGESDARRIAGGPLPSSFTARARKESTDATAPAGSAHDGDPSASSADAPFDPLRLCIFATIALLGWAAGPAALVVFAGVGFAGYWKARRAGLTRSKCWLRDTRLVLAYLALLTAAGLWGVWALIAGWLGA